MQNITSSTVAYVHRQHRGVRAYSHCFLSHSDYRLGADTLESRMNSYE